MLTIIHLENSRSDRLIWLLEELGLDYSVEAYPRDPETQRAPEAMQKLHPYAQAPMLRDGERLLIESGAIFEYVMGQYGDAGLVPKPGDPDWPDYLQWMHFAEGSAMLPILLGHFEAAGIAGPPGESMLRAMADSGKERLFTYVESVLAERNWLAGGRFTAADVMMGWVLDVAEPRGDLAGFPALQRYVAAIRARPGYQRAKARGAGQRSALMSQAAF